MLLSERIKLTMNLSISDKKCFKQTIRDITNRKKYITKFNNYISFSRKIISYQYGNLRISDCLTRMNAINKVIRILALSIQEDIIAHVLNNELNYHFDSMLTASELYCYKCKTTPNHSSDISRPESPIPFNLSMNPVISSCWNNSRLLCAFGNIGYYIGRPFKFDRLNHFSSILIMPINLLIIQNGFHSTTSGVYDTNAIYYPEYTLDISNWYKDIYFNGIAFFHSSCNSKLYSPEQKEIGIIYEIGRLLVENKLNLIDLHSK